MLVKTLMITLALLASSLFAKDDKVHDAKFQGHCEKVSDIMVGYECIDDLCKKKVPDVTTSNQTSLCLTSLDACRLTCGYGKTLWPLPTGEVRVSKNLIPINKDAVDITWSMPADDEEGKLSSMMDFLKDYVANNIRDISKRTSGISSYGTLGIAMDVKNNDVRLTQQTDESYSLIIHRVGNKVQAVVNGDTYFGLRHGMETLLQLVVYDDKCDCLLVPEKVEILNDKPSFQYRGIILDTSRSYFTVESIKRTIEAMAMNKMNTFHWHITDSQSFPYVSKKFPQMAKIGAYSQNKIYTQNDMKEIVEHARNFGIRVVPELDAPAHVGEGWQLFRDPQTGRPYLTCFLAQPWSKYCVEPPCGQLDPSVDGVYDVLDALYEEYSQIFDSDLFHMGGDEVSLVCWDTPEIKNWTAKVQNVNASDVDVFTTWKLYQERSLALLEKHNGGKQRPILWTSTLTEKENILNSSKYIIQVWTSGTDIQVKKLLEKGHDIILSNVDALYLDCGFNNWVSEGNNWCSPYKGWQVQYMNNPVKIVENLNLNISQYRNQLLGAEAALWSEQADTSSLDGRLWPRAAAMAERLWSNPDTDWRAAESRLMYQRDRMVRRGVNAELPEPLWCLQYEGDCPMRGV